MGRVTTVQPALSSTPPLSVSPGATGPVFGWGAQLLRNALRAGCSRTLSEWTFSPGYLRGSCVRRSQEVVCGYFLLGRMPVDKFTNMEEKLWILEDLNMMYIRQIALSLQVKSWLPVDHHLSRIPCTRVCCSFCAAHTSFHTVSKLFGVRGCEKRSCLTLFYFPFSLIDTSSPFRRVCQPRAQCIAVPVCSCASACSEVYRRGLLRNLFYVTNNPGVVFPLFFLQTAQLSLTANRKQHRMPSVSPSPRLPLPTGVQAQSTAAHMGLMSPCGNACMCVCVCRLILCSIRLSLRQYPTSLLCESPQSLLLRHFRKVRVFVL